jgi:hypothetical protein
VTAFAEAWPDEDILQQLAAQLAWRPQQAWKTQMSKRKSRGSRETSKLLEQMGISDEDEAPVEPQVLPGAQVLPETRVLPEAHVAASTPVSPRPAKRGSRAVLWALIIAVVAVAGGVAAWVLVFGAHP